MKSLTGISEHDELINFTEFLKACHLDYLTDDDGYAFWACEAKGEYDESVTVQPSDLVNRRINRPKWATHVLWIQK